MLSIPCLLYLHQSPSRGRLLLPWWYHLSFIVCLLFRSLLAILLSWSRLLWGRGLVANLCPLPKSGVLLTLVCVSYCPFISLLLMYSLEPRTSSSSLASVWAILFWTWFQPCLPFQLAKKWYVPFIFIYICWFLINWSYISFLGSGRRALLSLLPCQQVQALYSLSLTSSYCNHRSPCPSLWDTGWHSLLRWVQRCPLCPLFPSKASHCFPISCQGPLHAFLCFDAA